MKYALLLLLFTVGCAGTHSRAVGLGVLTDGTTTGGTANFTTVANKKYGIGGFGEVAVMGVGSGEDEYDGSVPGPESSLSSQRESGFAGGAIRGGVTMRANDRVAFKAGLSLWSEESYDEYSYQTLFPSASGRYQIKGDTEYKVGGVFGIIFTGEEGQLGLDYDTATETFGVSFGIDF